MRAAATLLAIAVPLAARQPERALHAMVNAQEPIATDIGVRVLKNGGNAVDAAVAVGFALAVTHPYAGNLGGGGFMLIRTSTGQTAFLDFRERAPEKASRNMFATPRESVEGWRSSGVPGTVRGMELAHRKYGKLAWATLLAPAIELASKGFPLSYAGQELIRIAAPRLREDPESRRIFLKNGTYFQAGETLVQPELARTLTRIAQQGAKDFYEGETARMLAAEMARHGGLITLADLKSYAAVERRPLEGSYRGYGIITAPPPSSGGIGLLQMLAMLDGTGYAKSGAGSAAAIHYEAEVMRRFFADRRAYLGDPDFSKLPVGGLLDPAYIRQRRASIDPARATPSSGILAGQLREHGETTHYNVIDAAGNTVAVTYTLDDGFGNGITVPGLGFLLNDEMDDFRSGADAPAVNAIQPGKRPVSSMTPTIVTRDGKTFLVVGSPGGQRIITAVLQVILNVVDFGMNVQDAVDAPRIHHQWDPDKLYLDAGISPDTVAILKSQGYDIDYAPGVVPARVEAILVDGGWLQGASDGRGSGKAAGY